MDLVGDPSGNGQQSDLGTLTQVLLFSTARRRLWRAEFVNRQSAQTFSLGFVQFAQRTNVPETDKHKAPAIARARAERRKYENKKLKRSAVNRLRNGGLFQGGRSVSNLSRVVSIVVFPLPSDSIITDNIQFVNTFFQKK